MADDVTIDNGAGTDYDVATDDDGSGNHVQIVKLAQAADGSRTAIPADSDGMLVNLGTNNDVVISDGGNTITVDGTVAVTHAALTELGTAIDTELQVDVVGALPAGNNNIGDVDVASLPGTVATDITAIKTAVEILDNTVAGSEMQVDIVSAPTLTVNSHAVTNAGTFAVQVDGAALTALQLIDNPILVDDAAFTPGTSSVSMVGYQADEASTDSVNEGDAGAARMTLDRKQITTPQPHGAGGLSIFRSLDLDESEEEVSTAACTVWGWYIANTATSTRFVKFYNATAANTTVGTTTPVLTLPIPGNSSDDIAANALGGMGIQFDTALSLAATTGVADNDTGAPGANEVIINIFYKA